MSWSHSSKLGLVLFAVLLVAGASLAAAVTVSQEDAPEQAEVGSQVTVTVELQDLYEDRSSWELGGQTRLENAQWNVRLYSGDQLVGEHNESGQLLEERPTIDQSASDAPDRVVVEVTGTAPPVEEYSYESPQTFLALELAEVYEGGPDIIGSWEVHHFTTGDPGSAEARTALDEANASIESARQNGTDVSDAEATFQEGVSAYNNANFSGAVSLAQQAESEIGGSSDDGSTDDGSTDDGSTDDGSTDDGSTDDGSTDDGSTDDGSTDGSTDDGSTDDGSTQDTTTDTTNSDAGNATNESGGDSDSGGGLLWVLLYAVLGLVILAAVVGGGLWYYQQQQGPSRDPLG